jgi:hypothetical protein
MSQLDFNSVAGISNATALSPTSAGVPFEQALMTNPRWAMSEGSLFFEGQGRVQQTLERIARRLDELELPYAVAGGMALYAHGYHRFTDDIDILMTRDDLHRLHEQLEGRGWTRPFSTSKNLRDAQTGVRIEFLVAGGFPGDGKPKPVQFPNPSGMAVEIGGIKYVNLPTFIELKLASGMTGENREKDLYDVKEIIIALQLAQSFAGGLNPYVREQFLQLWKQANVGKKRFVMDRSVAGTQFEQMLSEGVVLEGDPSDQNARLMTTDPVLAKKFGMADESETLS